MLVFTAPTRYSTGTAVTGVHGLHHEQSVIYDIHSIQQPGDSMLNLQISLD